MAKCKMWVNMENKRVESKMERKTYKVILKIGYKNESVKYFDRLTKNRRIVWAYEGQPDPNHRKEYVHLASPSGYVLLPDA